MVGRYPDAAGDHAIACAYEAIVLLCFILKRFNRLFPVACVCVYWSAAVPPHLITLLLGSTRLGSG